MVARRLSLKQVRADPRSRCSLTTFVPLCATPYNTVPTAYRSWSLPFSRDHPLLHLTASAMFWAQVLVPALQTLTRLGLVAAQNGSGQAFDVQVSNM